MRRTSLLHWEEHCHECATPLCYTSCSLYVQRADQKCSRFVYGIYPNPNFRGLFDFGADIRFRRWGKLETLLYGKSVSVHHHRLLDRINRLLSRPLNGASGGDHSPASRPLRKDWLKVFAKTIWSRFRHNYIVRVAATADNSTYDEFVLECFSPEPEPFRLTLEYSDREVKLRDSFTILPGWNFYTVPAAAFRFGSIRQRSRITLSPENNREKRLVFTWLDLVEYEAAYRPKNSESPGRRLGPAAKVKCVAWDLDNTLWKGILAEDSESRLALRPEALELIKKFDERGILQTAVSKNNFSDAWPVIERLGLQDYFLYPAINWQPKSTNLKGIAAKLNISLDTFALIDDSAFERAEVRSELPQVRVYPEDQLNQLPTYDEFNVPVSDFGKKRRISYLTEIRREGEREASGGDYEAFLASCQLKLRLSVPCEEKHVSRCLELIQRANQLNLSSVRYTAEEFRELLLRAGVLCVAMDCKDRFGDYGIVGFASVDESRERPCLRDLVLSCRVAQKRVEHAFVQWLARREMGRGCNVLLAELVRTDRNKPILQVFDDLNFRAVGEEDGRTVMELALNGNLPRTEIVAVEAEGGL